MSVLTSSQLLAAPSAATPLNVTSGAGAWASGAWVQFLAATGAAAQIAGVVVSSAGIASKDVEIDVGTGAGGSEVVVSTIRLHLGTNINRGPATYLLLAPVDLLPAATRVALRLRVQNGGATTLPLTLLYYEGLTSDNAIPNQLACVPSAADPVVVASVAPAWASSPWVQVSAGFGHEVSLAALTYQDSYQFEDVEFDIGGGAPGSEVVLTTLRVAELSLGGDEPTVINLPAILPVVAATPLSVRIRTSSGVTLGLGSWGVAILYYDATHFLSAVPPTPGDTSPCTITKPVFYGALSLASGTVLPFASRPVRNSGSYLYGAGYLPGRLVSGGQVQRSASDLALGSWPGQSVTVTLADPDRALRAVLASGSPPDFYQSLLYFYLIDEATRKAGGAPTILFQGPVYAGPRTEYLQVQLQANDIVTVGYSLFKQEKLIPQRTLRNDFPNAPSTVSTIPGGPGDVGPPIIYGTHQSVGHGNPTNGQFLLLNMGTTVIGATTYTIGLLCGHAIYNPAGVTVYQQSATSPPTWSTISSWGTDMWGPGQTGWSTVQPSGTPFTDLNGNRYTLFYFTGAKATNFANGTQPLSVDCSGIEDQGDGGGNEITDMVLQYQHLLVNWLSQSYTSGPWLSSPTVPFYPGSAATIPVVDAAAFATARAAAQSYSGGTGWVGHVVVAANGQRETIRDLLKKLNVSANVILRMNRLGQLGVVMLNRSRSTFLGAARTLVDRRDLTPASSFRIDPHPEWVYNDLTYFFAANNRGDSTGAGSGDGKWGFRHNQQTAPSIIRYGDIPATEYYAYTRDEQTADHIARQRLDFFADPPRLATWMQPLCGLAFDLGTGVPLTCFAGDGLTGYHARAMWIVSQSLDTSTCVVTQQAFDVDPLLS